MHRNGTSHDTGTVLTQHTPQNNDLIKGALGTATFYDGTWYPSADFTLDAGRMYLLLRQQSGSANLTVHGRAVDTTQSIALVSGWNWLGYNPQAPRQIGQALTSLAPADNDRIMSQSNGSATFFEDTWYPDSYELAPGRGYLLKLTNAQDFAYAAAPPPSPLAPEGEEPMAFATQAESSVGAPPPSGPLSWSLPIGKKDSMTIYAAVEIGGQRLESPAAQLAVFEGAEVAGTAAVMQGPTGKLYQLTAWSDATSGTMNLKAYDPSTSIVRDLSPSVSFTTNGIRGTIAAPVVFSAPALTNLERWRHEHFGSIANAGDAANDGDSDRDGVPNLIEYATAMNPAAHDRVPISATHSGSHLDFVFTKKKDATDLTYTVEWSDTLAATSWTTEGVGAPVVESEDASTQQVKVAVPGGSGVTRRFVRLKVSSQ